MLSFTFCLGNAAVIFANIYSKMYMLTTATTQETFKLGYWDKNSIQLYEHILTVCAAKS